MRQSLDEFAAIYANRPIRDNAGGMHAPHMFATWFMVRRLNPDLIIESGVFKGQGTWLLERACPDARLICIDINLAQRQYISDRATYSDRDFDLHDWADASDRTLAFFDDHQNARVRLQQCHWHGIRHAMFEDNYPPPHGDCYSLKRAFGHAGFDASTRRRPARPGEYSFAILHRAATVARAAMGTLRPQQVDDRIPPGDADANALRRRLEVYYEFPPVIRPDRTRWGDAWTDKKYPTPPPLLDRADPPSHEVFQREAVRYTWMCYAKLKAFSPG